MTQERVGLDDLSSHDFSPEVMEMREVPAPQSPVHPLRLIQPSFPAPLSDKAFHGLLGEIVRKIEPHSEADPAGILIQLLAALGNAIGPRPFIRVESDSHPPRINMVAVGETAKGRKGTSFGYVKRISQMIDPTWTEERFKSGLSSGEGLISQLHADDIDKRLLVVESEFASVLHVIGRQGNTLSALIRQAWDTGDIATLTKEPLTARGTHISVIGHITRDELVRHLSSTEAANGFANRFLWTFVRRSKLLPEGGHLDWQSMESLVHELRESVNSAQFVEEVTRDDDARRIWIEHYPSLSEGSPGLLGAVTGRAEAQVLRLSLIYALLDRSSIIKQPHLEAGLEVWRYAEESARYIFGDKTGDRLADDLLSELRDRRPAWMTRTEIRNHFSKNQRSERIDEVLILLSRYRKVESETIRDGTGRPTERWRAL